MQVVASPPKNSKTPRGFLPRPFLRADKMQKKISRGFAKSFPQKIVLAKPIRRAYDLGQSHHALRACLIRGSAGNESELFGIMTTRQARGKPPAPGP